MKKIVLSVFVLALLAACGGDGGNKSAEEKETPAAASTGDISENPDYQAGLKLVAGSDCLTCHKVDERIVGPSYKEVANKYPNADAATISTIAKTIIAGSQGKWGDQIMTPHPALSQADAEAMVKYVLLLK